MKNSPGEKAEIGLPRQEFGEKVLAGYGERIEDYFGQENKKATYIYDFGDYWEHNLELEKVIPVEETADYPNIN